MKDFTKIRSLSELEGDKTIRAFVMDVQFVNVQKNDFYLCQQLAVEIALHSESTKVKHEKIGKGSVPLWKAEPVNPFVGAVLLRKEDDAYRIYGCCRGAFDSDNHAEYTLLNLGLAIDCLTDDDYFFTTLEPCTQNSRHAWSKSCSDVLIAKGVRHIYIGLMDPNPLITGFGYRKLFEVGKDHFIDIKPFCHELRQRLVNDNGAYLNQFRFGDLRVYRDMDLQVGPALDDETVRQFIERRLSPLPKNSPYDDEMLAFYRYAVNRGHIEKSNGKINLFCVSDSFALAFYKEPCDIVDNATIQVVLGDGKKTFYNGPLLQFYDGMPFPDSPSRDRSGFWSDVSDPSKHSIKDHDFRHTLMYRYGASDALKKYELAKTMRERNDAMTAFCEDTLGIDKPEIIREAIANALMHRDYANGAFTTIYLDKKEIRIINPLPVQLRDEENKKLLEDKKAPSNPPNPKLMRLFMDYGFGEREGYGMHEFEQSDRVSISVSSGRITVTIKII